MPGLPRSLRDLVEMALAQHRTTSVDYITDVAKAAGYQVSHTTLNQILGGTYPYRPRRKTIEALSYLSGVSYEVAARAAGHASPVKKSFAAGLPVEADILGAPQRALVYNLIRLLAAMQREIAESGTEPGEDVSYLVEDDTFDVVQPGESRSSDDEASGA